MKNKKILSLILGLLLFTSCNTIVNNNFISKITYSNLYDNTSKSEIKNALISSGLDKNDIDNVLSEIDEYNKYFSGALLAKNGFITDSNLIPFYEIQNYSDFWAEKHNDFIGYNCRITSFILADNLINIDNPSKNESPILFMDNEAIKTSKNPKFTKEKILEFNTFFGQIDAKQTKNIDIHLKTIKKYWKDNNVSFNNLSASIITVWIHSELDNILFVGHTGILVPNKDSNKNDEFLFIEKISFEEPYQLLKFKNKVELNDYLMNKYDNWIPEKTARTFIMENDELLKGFRLNPKLK